MLARRQPSKRAGGPRIRCRRVSFGRRLALFFLLIAIVPTAALIGILLFVGQDSQRGKADARLAAGFDTAVTIFNERTADATAKTRRLAGSPDLATALRSGDAAALRAFTARSAGEPGSGAGRDPGQRLAGDGRRRAAQRGCVRAGGVDGPGAAGRRASALDDDRAAVRGGGPSPDEPAGGAAAGGATIASTVPTPSKTLEPDQTADLSARRGELPGHTRRRSTRATARPWSCSARRSRAGSWRSAAPAFAILVWFLVVARCARLDRWRGC